MTKQNKVPEDLDAEEQFILTQFEADQTNRSDNAAQLMKTHAGG